MRPACEDGVCLYLGRGALFTRAPAASESAVTGEDKAIGLDASSVLH